MGPYGSLSEYSPSAFKDGEYISGVTASSVVDIRETVEIYLVVLITFVLFSTSFFIVLLLI